MHSIHNEKTWRALSVEDKLDTLRAEIVTLLAAAEESGHKHHLCVDAINLIHGRLDGMARKDRKAAGQPEWT